jgi:hypothetical protein
MKRVLLVALAAFGFTGVYARKVKFRVDMTGQTINANGVHVAGNFQGWSPNSTAMTKEGTTNIYSVVADATDNSVIEFKFLNGNDWPFVESVPALSQKGHSNNGQSNDNRWTWSGSGSDTLVLPAFKYGANAPDGMYAVRFAVDLAKEASVSSNGVHLAGSLQGWNPGSTRMANLYTANKVYEVIVCLASGSYEYKFVNGNDWNSPSVPESVPSGCQTNGNRSLTVGTADQAVSKVCFGSCTACPAAPLPKYNVTFRVDMTNTDCDGAIDSVTVAGGKLPGAWGSGTTMAQVGTTKVYSVTLQMDSGEVEFKYRWHKAGATNWEGIANRIVVLKSDSTVALNCFGTTSACVAKPAPSTITFVVDLINETPKDTIWVMGSFTRPNWQGGAIQMNPVSGKPGLYSVTVNAICDGAFAYKFVNGDKNRVSDEENFPDTTQRSCNQPNGLGGFNRSYTRTSTNAVVINYVFNSCNAGRSPFVGLNESLLAGQVKVYPNPAQTYTVVEFNDNAASHQVQLTDLTGRVIRTYSNYSHNALRIEREGMAQGIYFIRIQNNAGEQATVKLVVQ